MPTVTIKGNDYTFGDNADPGVVAKALSSASGVTVSPDSVRSMLGHGVRGERAFNPRTGSRGMSPRARGQRSQSLMSVAGHGFMRGLYGGESDLFGTLGRAPGLSSLPGAGFLRKLSAAERKAAMAEPLPRGPLATGISVAASALGSAAPSYVEWLANLPFAALSGYEHGKADHHIVRDVLTEVTARKLLGFVSEAGVGRHVEAAVFPAVGTVVNRIEHKAESWYDLGAQFLLGELVHVPHDALKKLGHVLDNGDQVRANELAVRLVHAHAGDAVRRAASMVESMPAKTPAEVAALQQVAAEAGRVAENPAAVKRETRATLASRISAWGSIGIGYARLLKDIHLWKSVPLADQIRFIDAHIRGDTAKMSAFERAQSENLREYATRAARNERNAGVVYELYHNYFPFLVEHGDTSALPDASSRGARANFTKRRFFRFVADLHAAGYKLVTYNPAELMYLRLRFGEFAASKVDSVHRMVEDGSAKPLKSLPKNGKGEHILPPGWATRDVGGERYLMHPAAAKLFDRAYPAPSYDMLLKQQGTLGKLYRGWMYFNNVTIPAKLSLSAFHFIHLLQIDMVEHAVRPAALASEGTISKREALRRIARGPGMGERVNIGALARRIYESPVEELSPGARDIKALMIAGGFQPSRPAILRAEVGPAFLESVSGLGQTLREYGAGAAAKKGFFALADLLPKVSRHLQDPMFEDWIPALKTTAYLQAASALLESHPHLGDDPTALRAQLHEITRNIDERYGEMQYNTRFWDPIVKNAAFATIFSVGWKMGFFGQFARGLYEMANRHLPETVGSGAVVERAMAGHEGKLGVPRITQRDLYAAGYLFSSLLAYGLVSYLSTGRVPTLRDQIYPVWPNGERTSTQSFAREFGAMYYRARSSGPIVAAAHYAASSLKPALTSLYWLAQNHDYFGNLIRNTNASAPEQAAQVANFVFQNNLFPISMASLTFSGQTTPGASALSIAGYSPAPHYSELTPALAYVEGQYRAENGQKRTAVPDQAKREGMRKLFALAKDARTSGDWNAVRAGLADFVRTHPMPRAEQTRLAEELIAPPGAAQLRQIDAQSQLRALDMMDPETALRYLPFTHPITRVRYFLQHRG